MIRKFVSSALALMLVASTAHAAAGVAQLSQVQGKVLVNHGQGFEPANGLVELSPGDKVMVGKDSGAALSYFGSDCTVTIAPSSVVTVSEFAPCKSGETVGAVDSLIVRPAQGGEGGLGGGALLVAGGLGIAFVTIAILIATEDDNNAPPVSAP